MKGISGLESLSLMPDIAGSPRTNVRWRAQFDNTWSSIF